jgi:hypothetical protein
MAGGESCDARARAQRIRRASSGCEQQQRARGASSDRAVADGPIRIGGHQPVAGTPLVDTEPSSRRPDAFDRRSCCLRGHFTGDTQWYRDVLAMDEDIHQAIGGRGGSG